MAQHRRTNIQWRPCSSSGIETKIAHVIHN
jgi:hypothetical protein